MNKSILLLISLALTLCSCRENAPTAAERHQKQILYLSISTEPPTLDPARVTDSTSITVLHMLFEGLTRPSFEDPRKLAIAEAIEVSENGKTFLFHLRRTYWSNGDPLTAHDFVYAWKRVLAPDFPAEYASLMYPIKGAQEAKEGKGSLDDVCVKAIDDNTLEVKLNHPHPTFLDLIQLEPFLPVHRYSVERNPNWALEAGPDFVSNGPFILSKWEHHNQIEVKRNQFYWDAPAIRLNSISIQMVDRGDTELALFENGDIDWTTLIKNHPATEFEKLKADGKISSSLPGGVYSYVFNVNQPPFDHVKMRQAFSYAINRHDIVTHVLVNGEQATTRILPAGIALTRQPGFKDHDTTVAQKLFQESLQEMGITKEQLPPIIVTYNNVEHQHKIAQIVQNQWKNTLGVNVQLQPQEWKILLSQLNQRQFIITGIGSRASYADPLSFMQAYAHLDSRNRPGWNHPEFRKLIQEAEQARTWPEQKMILLQAENLMLREMPLIPIYTLGDIYLHNPNLKNVWIGQTGRVDLRYAYFETAEQDIELQRPNE